MCHIWNWQWSSQKKMSSKTNLMPLRNQPPTHIHFSSYNQTQVLTDPQETRVQSTEVTHDEVFYISKEWLELLIHTNRELENCVGK